MNLYLISQTHNKDYDTYDSAVVCAPDEETARRITPDTGALMPDFIDEDQEDFYMSEFYDLKREWVTSSDKVTVKLIGKAHKELKQGVVLASYNAG